MKNPYMSFWLSCANAYAGAVRGFWTGELQRQQSAMMNAAVHNWMSLWTPPTVAPAPPARKRRTQRRAPRAGR